MAATLWKSDRLVYRGFEKDDDDWLYLLHTNAETWIGADPLLPVPQTIASAGTGCRDHMAKCLMATMICLPQPPPPPTNLGPEGKDTRSVAVRSTTPIGYICLGQQGDGTMVHHRHAEIGITIHPDYQGQGYGSEAIQWALRWGFQHANLHRIGIAHFGYNEGAGRLYQRLGFTLEGRLRDFVWHDGEFHDLIFLSTLAPEWRAKNPKTTTAKQVVQMEPAEVVAPKIL